MKSINNNAPVKCSKTLIVNVSSEKVWATLTDINNWTTWQTDINRSVLHGDLKPETTFEWKSGGTNIISPIHTVEPFNSFGWTGKAFGVFAIHNWKLNDIGGQTIISVEESMEGFIAGLLKKSFNSSLEKGMQNWLILLKQKSEKQEARPV